MQRCFGNAGGSLLDAVGSGTGAGGDYPLKLRADEMEACTVVDPIAGRNLTIRDQALVTWPPFGLAVVMGGSSCREETQGSRGGSVCPESNR